MTTPPVLANGDINYLHVEVFLQLSSPLPPTSETSMDQDDVNILCGYYNAEVNLVLQELGFAFPITEAWSLEWIRWTKTLGVSAYVLLGIAAQDSDESITARANDLLSGPTGYQTRIERLIATGGEPLQAEKESDAPASAPVALSVPIAGRARRHLRFEQAVRVDNLVNDDYVSDFAPEEWLAAIKGF